MVPCHYVKDVMMPMNFDQAIARRQQLIEAIAACADEIRQIDRDLPVLQSMALEADLHQAEPRPLDCL